MAEPAAAPEPSGPSPEVVARPRTGGIVGGVAGWATLGAVLALWGVTGAARVVRAPSAALGLAVAFLPYLYGLVVAVGFVLWSAFPDRRTLPAAVTLAVLSAAVLWGPPLPSAVPEGRPVKVMTWNVRRLWGGPDHDGDPTDVAEATRCVGDAIGAADPDVLVLLEVSRDDADRLASRVGLFCSQTDYLRTGSAKTAGLAVCTRDATGARARVVSAVGQRYVDDEDWSYELAEIGLPSPGEAERRFNVLAVHLVPFGSPAPTPSRVEQTFRAQADQSAALLDRVGQLHDPTVLAGDFNSTRDAWLHTALRDTLADAWEHGGHGFGGTVRFWGRLPLRVDYIYTSAAFAVRSAEVPAVDCSDHRPVVASLILTR